MTLFPKLSSALCVCLLIFTLSSVHSEEFIRIINGEKAPEGRWPFMVSLTYNRTSHFCGATILNDDSILTAAHCMENFKLVNVSIYIGHTNLDNIDEDFLYPAVKYIEHPSWDPPNSGNGFDIGILKLSRKIDFSKGKVARVCLPTPMDKPIASKCVAIGWGSTDQFLSSSVVREIKPKDLSQVVMPVLDNNAPGCFDAMEDRHVCAGHINGGKDICYGDSGGPLLCPIEGEDEHAFYQYGISALLGSAKCGEKPSRFTRVSSLLDWIRENAEG